MPMSNTNQRILSAVILMVIVTALFFMGAKALAAFVLVAGLIAVDELQINFLHRQRKSSLYLLSVLVFLLPTFYFAFLETGPALLKVGVNAAVLLNIMLLVYLFYIDIESKFLPSLFKRLPLLAALLITLPCLSLVYLLRYPAWQEALIVLLFVNFGMDSAAWFFGKNFGKRKLWEKVSPKKTVEGLIGGVISTGLLGSILWQLFFSERSLLLFGVFCLLGLIAQVGDLVQSKIKRQFAIKDSSTLIPGHGGVYDRIDSLLFLAPFYVTALDMHWNQF
jgi:phosphatidate cytidylyltransferase